MNICQCIDHTMLKMILQNEDKFQTFVLFECCVTENLFPEMLLNHDLIKIWKRLHFQVVKTKISKNILHKIFTCAYTK